MKSINPSLLPLNPLELKDKVVLLIGATGCLGTEITKVLCKNDVQTILVARHIKSLEKLYDIVETLGKHSPALQPMNLMNIGIEDCQLLKKHIEQLFNKLDAIIFCSGKWGELTPIEHYQENSWLEIMHLNVNVPFILTKNLLPLLRNSQKSTVLFSESPLSLQTKAYHGAFNCSQKALRGLIELLDQENSYTSTRFLGINPHCLNSQTRRKLYPADPISEQGFEASQVAPVYAALLGELGEAHKGKTVSLLQTETVACEL